MRENKIEGIPARNPVAATDEVEEVVVDEKSTKSVASSDKPAAKAPTR
jgi:hypothetical protein